VLDRVTGSDPSVTDYILESAASILTSTGAPVAGNGFAIVALRRTVEYQASAHRLRKRDEYRLELHFERGRIDATEKYVIGYFGLNVSFEGEYRKVSDAP
jgi:hypothetical protein